LKVWECQDANKAEQSLHTKYDQFRQSGEWFTLSDDLLAHLLSLENLDSVEGQATPAASH
jgi:hypothetical protein